MIRLRFASLFFSVVLLGVTALPGRADKAVEPEKKQLDPVQKMQELLEEDLVLTWYFQKEMPLAEILALV